MSKTTNDLKIDQGELQQKALKLVPMSALNTEQRQQLLSVRNLEAVRRNMYGDKPIPIEGHLRWCKSVEHSRADHIYAVCENNLVVGMLGFRSIDWINKRCDWAFYLAPTLQGRGVGGALERTALNYVFVQLDFQKLNCEVFAFNEPVIGMHQKFGFQIEGRRRNHILRETEAFDVVLMGMTQNDYFKFEGTK